MQQDFVHLHLHSEFSLSDGIIRIEDLVEKSSDLSFSAVALTDLTNLFGLIKFYRLARKQGIKPIVGSEIKVAKDLDSQSGSLVLLVINKTGYTNLTKLVSKAYVEGQVSGEPIVKLSWLEEYSEGLIALSGGINGHIGQSILGGNEALTNSRVDYFNNLFKGNFFIEIQRLGKNNETGLLLLRIVELIGEDEILDLDDQTIYFINHLLIKSGLKKFSNKILITALPERSKI